MENSKDTRKPRKDEQPDANKPPGEFVSDELQEQTKRFLAEVKVLAKRRREATEEPGPPPAKDPQRSSRR